MNKKKRIEYFLTTLCVFLSGFILYGLIGLLVQTQEHLFSHNAAGFLLFGSIGGFVLSTILSTIILSVRFFAKRSLAFKFVAAVFWFFTFPCCVYVGIFMYIPYGIYNIIMILKKDPQPQELPIIEDVKE